MASGRLESQEHIVACVEKFPDAWLALFKCDDMGKPLLKVADH